MIRRATVEDIRPIYEMLEAYFDEAIRKRSYPLKWDPEAVVIYLGNLLWKDTGLNFISQNNEGVVLGELGKTWFGPNVMGNPAALYVKPEHRNGLIARALLRRFEKESIARGAVAISWDFWSGVSDNRMLDGMMKKLGYEYQANIYHKFLGVNHATSAHANSDFSRW